MQSIIININEFVSRNIKGYLLKIALLTFSNTTNIGDNIQTLAVAQHIDQDFDYVDRDFLSQYDGEPCAVVMNGWFSHEPQNWPPSEKVLPVFFGFHMTPETAAHYEAHKDYFKKYEPIGCRDQATADYMQSWGIDSYVSGCATMTFPKRLKEPEQPLLMLVDQTDKHFLREERRGYISISQVVPPYMSADTKFRIARELLDYYKNHAGAVITSRIHCAMPCAAMGVPVVYTGIREGRTAVVNTIGIRNVSTRRFPRTRLASLNLKVIDFEEKKREIINDLHSRLQKLGVKTKNP